MFGRLAYAAGAFAQAAQLAFRPRNDLGGPSSSQTPYQSAGQGRRTIGWYAPSSGPNAAVIGGLGTLRNRSRAAARNDGYASGAIGRLVTNIVGTGIKPLSKATDPTLRAAIQDLWRRWTDEADADGLLDFYGLQALAVRSALEAGEVFVRLRPRLASDGLTVPLQLQLLEAELCTETYTTIAPNGNLITAGIERDQLGRRVAYWFWRTHPGDALLQIGQAVAGQRVRVPADLVIHCYDPLRPGQLRGVPKLAAALATLKDLDEFGDAALLRQKLANLFTGFLKRSPNAADAAIDPLTGLALSTDTEGKPLVGLEPGMFQELAPGEEVEFSEPPGVDGTYEGFMRERLMKVAVQLEIPYEILTGDLSKVNDRTARMILNEFRRGIQRTQAHMVAQQVCNPTWRAWWDGAVVAGALPVTATAYRAAPEQYRAVDWTPQRWPYLNPVQDVQAGRDEVRAGFKSRRDHVSELGDDVEQVDQENADDRAREKRLGLVYDTNPALVAQTGAAQPDPSVPTQESA